MVMQADWADLTCALSHLFSLHSHFPTPLTQTQVRWALEAPLVAMMQIL